MNSDPIVKVTDTQGSALLYWAKTRASIPAGVELADVEFRVTAWPSLPGQPGTDVQLYITEPNRTDPGPGHTVLGYPLSERPTHAMDFLGTESLASLRGLVMPLAEQIRTKK